MTTENSTGELTNYPTLQRKFPVGYLHLRPEQLTIFRWDIKEGEKLDRRELRRSIENGMIEPLKIREMPLGQEVWDGEEILRITKEMDIEKVPCLSYGELDDEEVRALKFNFSLQRGDDIDMQKVHAEWLRLVEDEEWPFKKISDLYGVPESEVYSGASEYENQLDGSSDTFQQDSLAGWNETSEDKETGPSEQRTNNPGFNGKGKDLKGARDPIIEKKPKEIEIMISGRLDDYLSEDIEGESHSVPSKIVEILNLYYGLE